MSYDKKIIVVSLILLVLAAGGYFYIREKHPEILSKLTASQAEAIRAKAEKFINEQMLPPGSDAKITEMSEENGLYKIIVSVQGQDLTAYISQDGKNFFPQAFNMDSAQNLLEPSASPQNITKQDKPEVELFVMSYCPYGLQVEKGILPVVELLGSKINFSLKFVDYAMHGDKEIQENLRQYCVQQQGLAQLESYLNCFVKQGNAETCLAETKIDTNIITSCISATDSQFKITQNAEDETLWRNGQFPPFDINKTDVVKYAVSGSPSLVVNGTKVSTSRDPQGLLNLICSAFSVAPDECEQQLSSVSPSAGFGEGSAVSANSNSGCGN